MAVLLSSTHKGNIYEILGDFLLSLLGIANPIRRQFDHGYDFYCSISNEANRVLTFDSPFAIQTKSGKDLKVEYGKNFEKWKLEDISWLFNHQTPFFIGFINTENKSLNIYDTTGIWFLYGREVTNCSQITFKPNERKLAEQRELPKETLIKNWGKNKGDGVQYEIDLGNPIINISIDDINNPELIHEKKNILKSIIDIERENIINRNLGIFCFKEIKQNITNKSRFEWGTQFLNSYDEQYIFKIYE